MGVALGSSVGLLGGSLANKGPARHDLSALVGAWGRAPVGPLTLSGDLIGTLRGQADGVFAHRTMQARLAAVIGPGTGDERAHVGLGLGPGLVVRQGRVGDRTFVDLTPGLRTLAHLDVRLAGPLALRFQMGSLTRGVRRWDFDAALGVGAWL